RWPSSISTKIPTRRAVTACAESRPCFCSRAASPSPRRLARRRAARSSSGWKAISPPPPRCARPESLSGRLGPLEPSRVRSELLVPRELILRREPAYPASPKDMELRSDHFGIVERRDAEIDRFRLVIDLHQEGRAARSAE